MSDTASETNAIKTAIQSGIHDENRLTDLVFNTRHPERNGQKLASGEKQLAQEWVEIRDKLVRPALRTPASGGAGAVPRAGARPASTTSGVEAD